MAEEATVPSQVEEAAELAEKLFAKMYATEEVAEEEESETQEEEEDSDDTSDDDDAEDEEIEPELDPKELKKWRDRYLTLKGKYDAEVPRLASQVKELMEKVSSPPSKQDEQVEEEDDFESTYGEDFVSKIRKVIDQSVQAKLSTVEQKVESVEDIQRQAATDSFTSYLDENAEGWRDCWEGKDKGFQKFLQQKDPMGLSTYETYLNKFNDEWDADGMAKIFNLYNETKTKKSSRSAEQDAMIAPSRTKANTSPSSNEKRIWTEETMKAFEIDDRKGKYSDEDSQALWADLLAAANEGRIRP
jgi:hypothetical protein